MDCVACDYQSFTRNNHTESSEATAGLDVFVTFPNQAFNFKCFHAYADVKQLARAAVRAATDDSFPPGVLDPWDIQQQ